MGNGHEKQADSEGGKTKMNRIEDVTDYITECDKEVGEALEELEGGAVHVVPRKKKYIWDLIQEGCGYPNRNKAWKGVPAQVPSAAQF